MEQEKMTKFNKIFPWYAGLSGDLLFWVAIDTLFLTVVKKFNASQIVSLTTVSLITCIALQVPLFWYNCNEMLKIECPKYGIKYIDTSKDREKVLSEILENLFK